MAEHMKEGSIRHLVRLQEVTLAEARQLLRHCVGEQATAETVLADAVLAIARETERVMRGSGDDREVETFGAWLVQGREAVATAEARLRAATADTAIARAAFGLAENAASAAGIVMHQRDRAEPPCGSR